jgi:molybdenum cofactor synthesis domain-containing protein
MSGVSDERVTAAVLVIGDEILSGRTQDTNTRDIARYLSVIGVDLAETRTVPDVQEEIVAALNALRERYDYVVTTGGIGPTHDDITADAVAAAFGVELEEHPEIIAMMAARWGGELFEELFVRTVRQCVEAGLVDGTKVHLDGSLIDAAVQLGCDGLVIAAMGRAAGARPDGRCVRVVARIVLLSIHASRRRIAQRECR